MRDGTAGPPIHRTPSVEQSLGGLFDAESSGRYCEPVADRRKAGVAAAVKLLPKLIEASSWGQQEAAEQVGRDIAQLLQPTHPQVAEKILKRCASSMRPSRIVRRPDDLVDFCAARHGLDEVILPEQVERECRAIMAEHQRADELAQFRLIPRHKLLLYGPPGNGKTLLAEALAKELDLPFLPVKYAGMIESYLGSTGKNLQNIFDYAATAPCVLFMDEFDGVAIDRGDSKDVGEIRRVTNQLLILLDRLPSSCMFVAATNADELLDRAIQRRFDFVVEIPAPQLEVRRRCVLRELAPELTPGYEVTAHAEAVASLPVANLSGLVQLCRRIRRDLVLNRGAGVEAILAGAREPLKGAVPA